MNALALMLAVWLPFSVIGGAVSSVVLVHFWIQYRQTRRDASADDLTRELAELRVIKTGVVVMVWGLFVFMGLRAAGIQPPEALWVLYAFATMFALAATTLRLLKLWRDSEA